MATAKKRVKKDGSVVFDIRANGDISVEGKRTRPTKTWTPNSSWSEMKTEKELQKQLVLFEDSVKSGILQDENIKFKDFSERFLTEYADKKLKAHTSHNYRNRLNQIYPAIGHIKLRDLRTGHLNSLYARLQKHCVNYEDRYTVKIDLLSVIANHNMNKTAFAKAAGIAKISLNTIINGDRVIEKTALAVCSALDMDISDVFNRHSSNTLVSASTVHTYHRIISAVLAKAVKWGFIAQNPAINAELPKITKHKAPYLDEEDARRLLTLLHSEPIKYRTMIALDLLSGLRRGELLGLRWRDIDFDSETITVSQTLNYVTGHGVYVDTPKTRTSERPIKLARSAFILLLQYKQGQDEQREKCGDYWKQTDDRIFTADDGGVIHPDTLSKWFKKFVKQNNFPDVHLHSLRHTYASLMIADGIPLVVVSNNLGHAQVSTTADIYSHVIKSAAAKAADSIDSKFSDIVETSSLVKEYESFYSQLSAS